MQTSATLSQALAAVEQGLGQLRTAVVALELRPPVEGGASVQGTLQVIQPQGPAPPDYICKHQIDDVASMLA